MQHLGAKPMPDFERTIPSTPVVTTADAKLFLRQDLTVEDSLIDNLIASATREVEAFASIALITQTITATFDGPFTAGRLRLPVGPVLDTATATVTMIEPDGTETPLDSAFFSLRAGKAPALWVGGGSSLPTLMGDPSTALQIEYPGGYGGTAADVPEDLRHAVLEQTAMLYEHRALARQHRHQPSMSPHAQRIAQRYRRSSV